MRIRTQKYTRFQVLDRIRREIVQDGSQAAFARRAKVSPAYVSDVLKGRRDPGPSILVALKMKFVVQSKHWYENDPFNVSRSRGRPESPTPP